MKRRESIRHAKESIAKSIANRLSVSLPDDEDFHLLSIQPLLDVPGVRVEARVRVQHPGYEGGEVWEHASFDVLTREVMS